MITLRSKTKRRSQTKRKINSECVKIIPLAEACTRFLESQLDPCNCIGMKDFAETHSLTDLFRKSSAMIMKNFADVVQHEEFLELPKSRVIDYISDDLINVHKEETVFEAVKRWVHHDFPSRCNDFPEILSYVRLPLIHPNYFMNSIESDELIAANPACQEVLLETRKYHILGTVNEINSIRTRPRQSTGCSESVVIVGGCDRVGGYNMPYVDAYDAVSSKWTQLAKLPAFTKSEYAVASFRNSIIVSGGRIHSRDVWLYQSHLDSWVKGASLCKGRWRHRMATVGGHVYCFGGYDGKSRLNSVERYDSFSNCWQEVAPLLTAVSSCAVATCNRKIYVIGGGNDDTTSTAQVQCYNPDTNEWVYKTPIPIAQRCITAVSLDNLIYVVGGTTKSIHCYDPLTDDWIKVVHTQEKQESCGMTVCGGKIYITGGKSEEGLEALDAVTCYDPRTGSIEKVATMPRSACYHGCVTIHRFSAQAKKEVIFSGVSSSFT
ncbi:kelch-like protein 24 isoform X2 [Styela clava]|uniref:kelch-like protein 24 isoform X2 n=1 Tax=Styela clava TaxID=7725 RepID=UPI00193AA69A|nr:kelch-like protein 24 isoform X2 [Styela clava]